MFPRSKCQGIVSKTFITTENTTMPSSQSQCIWFVNALTTDSSPCFLRSFPWHRLLTGCWTSWIKTKSVTSIPHKLTEYHCNGYLFGPFWLHMKSIGLIHTSVPLSYKRTYRWHFTCHNHTPKIRHGPWHAYPKKRNRMVTHIIFADQSNIYTTHWGKVLIRMQVML